MMRSKRPLREPVREAPGPKVKNYITPAGLQRLKDEHRFLLNRERPEVTKLVTWAASNGDRSENADYLYNKRRLRQIDSRIRFLSKRIDAAEVVDPAAPRTATAAARVFFGATVTYEDPTGQTHVVRIVGIDEVDVHRRYISWKSPLARALLKASAGDRVVLHAPKKTETLEILEVEYTVIPMDAFRAPGRKLAEVLDTPTPADRLTYQIDSIDRISAVSASWDLFAAANGDGTRAIEVVGHSLWDFVVDNTTRNVYRDLIARARGGRQVAFSYRCDSPSLRRFMRMTMSPGAEGTVTFDSLVVRTEPREAPAVTFSPDIQTGDLLRICSWCKRVAIADAEWVELEVAVERLGLMAEHFIVGVTHGMCPTCFTRVMEEEIDVA